MRHSYVLVPLLFLACGGQTEHPPAEPENPHGEEVAADPVPPETETDVEETEPEDAEEEPDAPEAEALPDPPAEEASRVTDFIRAFIDGRAEDDVYDIPERGGHDVSASLAEFHTVHQRDANTYAVCADFHDGDHLYDVDFFVDRSGEELAVADHYLHKIDGVAIEE